MRTIKTLVTILVLGATLHVAAQGTTCSGAAVPGLGALAFLGISPPMPSSAQPVSISTGRFQYIPTGITAQIEGNAINVTLTGFNSVISLLPIQCITTTFVSIPAGTYTVKVFSVLINFPDLPPSLFATTTLTVVDERANTIPATSVYVLFALALSVVATGFYVLSIRRA